MKMSIKTAIYGIAVLLAMASTTNAMTLNAAASPTNGGAAGWAIFFDLESLLGPLTVTHLQTANTADAAEAFSIEVFTRSGTALTGVGNSVATGPGSSNAGWTSLGVAAATQGATSNGISEQIDIPDIAIGAGQVVGVALQFSGAGPRYDGVDSPAYSVFADAALQLTTGDSRTQPFTTGGSLFASRALVGSVTYVQELDMRAIPEPVTAMLGLMSFGALGLATRRRRA